MPPSLLPQHPRTARPCLCVIANPAQKWVCRKNAIFLTSFFWGVGFNSAADNTTPKKTLAIQMPQAPSGKPSRLCYTVLPPLYNIPPFMRFCLKVYFSDKKQKKAPLSGIEPRTTDTSDARDATTAIGSIFFTPAARSAVFSLPPPPPPPRSCSLALAI